MRMDYIITFTGIVVAVVAFVGLAVHHDSSAAVRETARSAAAVLYVETPATAIRID